MNQKTTAAAVAASLAALLLFPLLLFGGMVGITAAAAASVCDPSGPAVAIDPATVAEGPVAGWQKPQLVNAAIIAQVGGQLHLTKRDQQIAIMTAMAESSLRVLDFGDTVGPDSRGLFQQRDNGAWGTLNDRLNPATSATNFYNALVRLPQREGLEPWQAAHLVQGNSDAAVYQRRWREAGLVLASLFNQRPTPTPTSASAQDQYGLAQSSTQARLVAATVGQKYGLKTITAGQLSGTGAGIAPGNIIDLHVPRSDGQRITRYLTANATSLGVAALQWRGKTWSTANPGQEWVTPSTPRPAPGKKPQTGQPTKPTPTKPAPGKPTPKKGEAKKPEPKKPAPTTEVIQVVVTATDTPADLQCPDQQPAMDVDTSQPINAQGWVRPAAGRISSPYGQRIHPISGRRRWHYGLDFAPGCGAAIRAVAPGIVVRAGPSQGFGNLIEIDHGTLITRYGHMYSSGLHVRVGDEVVAGQRIADVGDAGASKGCHLHFEIMRNGHALNPGTIYR